MVSVVDERVALGWESSTLGKEKLELLLRLLLKDARSLLRLVLVVTQADDVHRSFLEEAGGQNVRWQHSLLLHWGGRAVVMAKGGSYVLLKISYVPPQISYVPPRIFYAPRGTSCAPRVIS